MTKKNEEDEQKVVAFDQRFESPNLFVLSSNHKDKPPYTLFQVEDHSALVSDPPLAATAPGPPPPTVPVRRPPPGLVARGCWAARGTVPEELAGRRASGVG